MEFGFDMIPDSIAVNKMEHNWPDSQAVRSQYCNRNCSHTWPTSCVTTVQK